ncbi:phage minor tail protein L [Shigella sonnei]|nr:phage minor tail protein L [Shigella sonnei]
MQDIRQETLNECTRAEQSASVVLWEIDLTEVGGERYFFCNEQNEKGEPVTWQGRQYQAYPIQGSGFELNGKGTSTRPTLAVSNLYGMVTGMVEDMQSLVGGTVVRRKVYARFLDAVNFVNGNSDADPEQEVISRWRIEQCSELSAVSASFVLSTPTETDGAVFPGRIMLANTCTWTYRGLLKQAMVGIVGSIGSAIGGAVGGGASASGGTAIQAAAAKFHFATGGFTGTGGKYEPAGIVHRGEFVFTKEATSRIGVGNLYRLMRGYAEGGYVGGAGSPAQMRRAEGINFNQNNHVVIQNDGTNGLPGPQMMKAVYDMARKGARDEIQTQMRDGGLFSGGGR